MQRIVITGGAGFIGSHLCRKMLSLGHAVVCVDNLLTGALENISELKNDPKFSFVELDVSGSFKYEEISEEKIDAIFHLASPASPNQKSPKSYIAYPIETLLVNSVGTYNMLLLAKEHNARFLYTSSSEVYGDPDISPQPETYFGNVNPNGIRSVYDEGKRFGEAITMAFFRKHRVDMRIIRIFNTFGPRMQKDDGRVVSNFITQALSGEKITIYGEGNQTRSFCYIDDMVEGLCKAMFSDGTKGEVFNLGNPDERTIKELATMVKDAIQTTSEIVYESLPEDDPKRRKPDISKAKRVLGWQPLVTIEEGLQKTVEYFSSR